MKTNIIITLLFVSSLYQCGNAINTQKEDNCKKIGIKIGSLILNYTFYHDTTYTRLDSAMYLIDSIFCDCSKYYTGLTSSKLKIFSYKKEYSKAISFITTLDDSKLRPLLKKSILLNRFHSMESQQKGDTASRNKYIRAIIAELKDSLSNIKIDSVLQESNELNIIQKGKGFTLTQYYYYRSQIEGVDKISIELDAYQKRISGNKKFFDFMLKKSLNDNYMDFNGL